MGKDSGVIYKSFVDAARKLDDQTRLEAMDAYFDYLFEDTEYEGGNPVVDALMTIMKPSIDKAGNRYEAACENGKKGGAPKGNSNAKKQPENNQKTTRKQPENNQSSEKNNLTDAVAVTDAVTDAVAEESIEAGKRPTRHKYGEYKHVLLSDHEHEKLVKDYGEYQTTAAIKKVDEYCQRTGKTYKDYNLVLRKWGYEGIGPPQTEDVNAELRRKWVEKFA